MKRRPLRTVVTVREIPRGQWPAFFDQFSRTHRAWLAAIETTSPACETREDRARPLRSITPFVHNNRVDHIDIRFEDDTRARPAIRIPAPVVVRVDETTEGIVRGLEIVDSRGGATRLRFRASPRPESLDGLDPDERT